MLHYYLYPCTNHSLLIPKKKTKHKYKHQPVSEAYSIICSSITTTKQ